MRQRPAIAAGGCPIVAVASFTAIDRRAEPDTRRLLLPRVPGRFLPGLAGGLRIARAFHGVVMFLGNPPTWTDARVELAKQLFEAGATASQAGAKLGVTRNAMIGKWHRMGLVRAPKQRSLMRARKPIARKERIARTPKRLPPTFFAEPLPPPVETDIARVSLMDLERHHCRFPVGDPKDPIFGFCGCQPYPGLPYCEAHARRAYTPATLKTEPGPSFNVSIRNRTPNRELVDA